MTDIKQIQALIDTLPNIFIYIVPGYIFIQIYNYILNLKGQEIKNYIFEYLIASFIINSISQIILKIINYFCKTSFTLSNDIVKLIICFSSVVLAYITSMIMKSEKWRKAMTKVNINRNNASNIFSDLIDYDYGTWVRVYLNNEKIVYDGALVKFHYKDTYNDSFVVLDQYITYGYGAHGLDDTMFNKDGKCHEHVAIKVSEINRVEVTYCEDSKKIVKNSKKEIKGKKKLQFNFFKKIKTFGMTK